MANTFVLELEGKTAARLVTFESTGVNMQVVTGSQPFNRLSKVVTGTLGEIKIKFGADATRPLLDWMVASAYGNYGKKSGAVIVLDSHSKVLHRIEFGDAQVTSFTLPALDRSSKGPAYFSASFRPAILKHTTGGDTLTAGSTVLPAQKIWNTSNFRFQIDGLDTESAAISKVSSFSLNTAVKQMHLGDRRLPDVEPTGTTYSNVVIVVPMSKASGILSWFDQAVNRGTVEASEKTASLEFLGPADKMTYFTAEFTEVGIISTSTSKVSGDSNRDLIAELYCNSIRLKYL